MAKPASEMTQHEINEFCRATSAVYFEVVWAHALRTGMPVRLPDLLCPRDVLPSTDGVDPEVLREAERFLVRMGVIGDGGTE